MGVRYLRTVMPDVSRELRRWRARAGEIPDPSLRALALGKLERERFNAEVAATLAAFAPAPLRRRATEAIVALEVMFDYLDGLSEQPAPDPLGCGRRLFSSFETALTPGPVAPVDYYAARPGEDDDGYLQELAMACRGAFRELPRAEAVAPAARRAAALVGEAQSRIHAIEALGVDQVAEWATAEARGTGLAWWEFAAGAAALILAPHLLIVAAADTRTTAAEAEEIAAACLCPAAVSTLLDSLIDRPRDLEEGSHSFLAHYPGEAAEAEGVAAMVRRAVAATHGLRHGPSRHVSVVSVAAYFLSAPEADLPSAAPVKARVVRELRPLIYPILGFFHLWRFAKRARGHAKFTRSPC